jgi:protein-tyrosine-phosphatase
MEKTIVFVCTANRCRSVIAEVLFKLHFSQIFYDKYSWCLKICSAGILTEDYWEFINLLAGPKGCKADKSAFYNVPPYPETIRCLAKRGIDVSSYRSQPMDARLARTANMAVTMEDNQKVAVLDAFPQLCGKVVTFRDFVGETAKMIYEDTLFKPVFDAGDPHCVYYPKSYVEANYLAIEQGFSTGQPQIEKILRSV